MVSIVMLFDLERGRINNYFLLRVRSKASITPTTHPHVPLHNISKNNLKDSLTAEYKIMTA